MLSCIFTSVGEVSSTSHSPGRTGDWQGIFESVTTGDGRYVLFYVLWSLVLIRQSCLAAQQAARSRRTGDTGRGETTYDAKTLKTGMTLQEAVQILNIEPDLKDIEQIDKNYKHLFEANDKSKGGSLYLQSKVDSCYL